MVDELRTATKPFPEEVFVEIWIFGYGVMPTQELPCRMMERLLIARLLECILFSTTAGNSTDAVDFHIVLRPRPVEKSESHSYSVQARHSCLQNKYVQKIMYCC